MVPLIDAVSAKVRNKDRQRLEGILEQADERGNLNGAVSAVDTLGGRKLIQVLDWKKSRKKAGLIGPYFSHASEVGEDDKFDAVENELFRYLSSLEGAVDKLSHRNVSVEEFRGFAERFYECLMGHPIEVRSELFNIAKLNDHNLLGVLDLPQPIRGNLLGVRSPRLNAIIDFVRGLFDKDDYDRLLERSALGRDLGPRMKKAQKQLGNIYGRLAPIFALDWDFRELGFSLCDTYDSKGFPIMDMVDAVPEIVRRVERTKMNLSDRRSYFISMRHAITGLKSETISPKELAHLTKRVHEVFSPSRSVRKYLFNIALCCGDNIPGLLNPPPILQQRWSRMDSTEINSTLDLVRRNFGEGEYDSALEALALGRKIPKRIRNGLDKFHGELVPLFDLPKKSRPRAISLFKEANEESGKPTSEFMNLYFGTRKRLGEKMEFLVRQRGSFPSVAEFFDYLGEIDPLVADGVLRLKDVPTYNDLIENLVRECDEPIMDVKDRVRRLIMELDESQRVMFLSASDSIKRKYTTDNMQPEKGFVHHRDKPLDSLASSLERNSSTGRSVIANAAMKAARHASAHKLFNGSVSFVERNSGREEAIDSWIESLDYIDPEIMRAYIENFDEVFELVDNDGLDEETAERLARKAHVFAGRHDLYVGQFLAHRRELSVDDYERVCALSHSIASSESHGLAAKSFPNLLNAYLNAPEDKRDLFLDLCSRILQGIGKRPDEFSSREICKRYFKVFEEFYSRFSTLVASDTSDAVDWVERGVAENPGLDSLADYLNGESYEGKRRLQGITNAVKLEEIHSRVLHYATAMCGYDFKIIPTEDLRLSIASDEELFLPREVAAFEDEGDNFSVYKALTSYQTGCREFGTFDLDEGAIREVVRELGLKRGARLDRILEGYEHPQLAQELFTAIELGRVHRMLGEKYPGLRKHLDKTTGLLLPKQNGASSLESCLLAVADFCFSGEKREVEGREELMEDVYGVLGDSERVTVGESIVVNHEVYSLIEKEFGSDIEKAVAPVDIRVDKIKKQEGDRFALVDKTEEIETTAQGFWYPEFDHKAGVHKPEFVKVTEQEMPIRKGRYVDKLLEREQKTIDALRERFELMKPEEVRRRKRLESGDLCPDSLMPVLAGIKAGLSADSKVYSRRFANLRNVGTAVLMELSGSLGDFLSLDSSTRISDLVRKAVVYLGEAFDVLGDTTGIYGFAGSGREGVLFHTIKGIDESYDSQDVKDRIGSIVPLGENRDGAGIRHAVERKLVPMPVKSRILFYISDGRPHDIGYEGEYALQDTRNALLEAGKVCRPVAIVLNKEPSSDVDRMYEGIDSVQLSNLEELPEFLPEFYGRITR